jgi:hypothetical protein
MPACVRPAWGALLATASGVFSGMRSSAGRGLAGRTAYLRGDASGQGSAGESRPHPEARLSFGLTCCQHGHFGVEPMVHRLGAGLACRDATGQRGKYLIGLYLGRSAVASTFGAASTRAFVRPWLTDCITRLGMAALAPRTARKGGIGGGEQGLS